MTKLRSLLITVVLLALAAVPTSAQTTLNSTTLAAAVTSATANQFQLASTSNISVGDLAVVVTGNVVREIAIVRAVTSPYITVTRDAVGVPPDRAARLHANASTVYTGARGRFYTNEVNGACTRASEQFLPHINTLTGNVSQCSAAGVWYRLDQQFNVSCVTGVLYTNSIDQTCWTARDNYVITAISYVSRVAESGGTLTVIPRRQESTEAPASGDALATALSGVSTVAETVTAFALTATSALLLLDAGDRLGIDFTDDVAGELAGVVVTFTLAPR